MKFVIKFSFWCLLVFCFWLSVSEIFHLSSGERDEPDAMLRSLSSLDKDSKSNFLVGSSKIQRSVNSIIL